ncbi:hypothetical protein Rleg10DRAFT_7155 [Rhizobium leguminosarum bv. trifolii WSM2012]|nr:hypothetical protein Rleg10DRAFT_7155 [Rhizobium leguminosarum bv. trifolii WSM2012]
MRDICGWHLSLAFHPLSLRCLLVYTAEFNPLCYPGTTVLRNKLDLTHRDEMDEFEAAVFVVRSDEPKLRKTQERSPRA